jgi:hypothetical protein
MRPRTSKTQLSALGRDVVRKAGIPELEDFAANVDDPAETALFHSRQDLLQHEGAHSKLH